MAMKAETKRKARLRARARAKERTRDRVNELSSTKAVLEDTRRVKENTSSKYLTKEDKKYIDLLDEDEPIAGQKFVCISFLSPENILKRRELFLFEQFVKTWEMTKSISIFGNFLQYISSIYKIDMGTINESYSDFITTTLLKQEFSVTDDFKTFCEMKEEKLTHQFNQENDFQTNVRGLKIRGVFASEMEAQNHSKKLRKYDTHHDIFVAPCGFWLPWDPTLLPGEKMDYLEPELNKLHEEKIKGELYAKSEFEERVRESKRDAIQHNIELAKRYGNKLTQTIDENANLINADNIVKNYEKSLI